VDTRIQPDVTMSLLSEVERLGEDAVGCLQFRGRNGHVGNVLVERGRVCWAVAERMAARLTDILVDAATPPLDRGVIERVYRSCRERGRPLGEALVDARLITPDLLRRALLRHNTEALIRLAMSGAETRFVPNDEPSYAPRFTFSTAELLVTAGTLRNRVLAAAARAELAACVPSGVLSLAIARSSGGTAIPVALQGGPEPLVTEVDLLARASRNALDVALLIDPATHVVLERAEQAGALVAWAAPPLLFAAFCEDISDATYVLAASNRRRRSRT
jgi:hypothetical protein